MNGDYLLELNASVNYRSPKERETRLSPLQKLISGNNLFFVHLLSFVIPLNMFLAHNKMFYTSSKSSIV